ncbi:hypothetical protein QQS21_009120 [Conoideocrella luteorostrata]|uniref:Uncharacterized protein n=1 Tax=Conoideocrella luteorostrata TaxID=1105319 RepID=A0AAJ0CHL8_9HYPO|nr:hypothetical protein QQS21_009120 [Conoideocrella luteorostrata]
MKHDQAEAELKTYSQFACVGAGISGIALGATLKRWYGITDVRFFERHSDFGGTWLANKYPGKNSQSIGYVREMSPTKGALTIVQQTGCACDVPSLLYSFSFAPNPKWTKALPSHDELWAYLKHVANEYDLETKTTFQATVELCEWVEAAQRWRVHARDAAGRHIIHESQFLFTGTGHLVKPRVPDFPGLETFKGPVLLPCKWPADANLQNKRVIVVGNGCTASQIVPAISHETKHVTQIVRSKHWIVPPVHVPNDAVFRFLLVWVPGFLKLVRLAAFLIAENHMRGFYMTKAGARYRKHIQTRAEAYIRKTAPAKYHSLLIPDFEIGCKRRVFDSGYLKSLHAENVTLTDDPIVKITPDGLETKKGSIRADVLIMATGYDTNTFMSGINIIGREGKTVSQHWESLGGPGAYNSVSMSGFPNFFMLLGTWFGHYRYGTEEDADVSSLTGPNTATGHTSTILAIENAVNYALRIIKPALDGECQAVDVDCMAERKHVQQIQEDLKHTVWSSGCNAWYTRDDKSSSPRNAMTYPYSQPYFWYKCLFPTYSDWNYS